MGNGKIKLNLYQNHNNKNYNISRQKGCNPKQVSCLWQIHEEKEVIAMTENIRTRKMLKDIAMIDTFNEIINAAMLTDEDRFILTEHYLKGKNFAYIADELGYAEITVNKRHCKILQKLSRILR